MKEIRDAVRTYILKEFLPGVNAGELTDSTPLITGGILDSLATLKLVLFLEERYGFEFQAHEVNADYLDTVAKIAEFVRQKA